MAHFEKKIMDLYVGDFVKIGPFQNFELNASSCRVFHGLSENYKIIEIEQPKLEL